MTKKNDGLLHFMGKPKASCGKASFIKNYLCLNTFH